MPARIAITILSVFSIAMVPLSGCGAIGRANNFDSEVIEAFYAGNREDQSHFVHRHLKRAEFFQDVVDRWGTTSAEYDLAFHSMFLDFCNPHRSALPLGKIDWELKFAAAVIHRVNTDATLVDQFYAHDLWRAGNQAAAMPELRDAFSGLDSDGTLLLVRLHQSYASGEYIALDKLHNLLVVADMIGDRSFIPGSTDEIEPCWSLMLETLSKTAPYLVFDQEKRRYVIDQSALQSSTPVSPQQQVHPVQSSKFPVWTTRYHPELR